MIKQFKDCIDAAVKSLADLGTQEVEQYVKKTLENAKKTGLSGQAALEAAKNTTYNEVLEQVGSDAQRAANSVVKFEKALAPIGDKKATVRDFVSRGTKNISNNIESAQLGTVNELMDSLTSSLNRDDLKFLQDNRNRIEISKAVDGVNINPQANRIGKAINDYITHRNSRMILSDALSIDEIQSDRWLRAIHNRSRLINPSNLQERAAQMVRSPWKTIMGKSNFNTNAPSEWLAFIKERLDLEETFKNTDAFADDGLDDAKVDDILNNIYRNITEGRSDIFQKTGVLTDIQSLKKRRRMFFHWKDFQGWSQYNEQYGAGNIFGALMADIHGGANKIGLADIFGAAPDQTFEALRRSQDKEGIQKGALWHFNTSNIYKWVKGESKVAVSMKFATIAANLRAFGSMARLGGIVGQSLTDTNIAASYATRFGISYGEAFSRQLSGLAGQFTSPELKEFGEMMHLNMRHHMGYIGRFVEAQNIGNITAKLSSHYFQGIGMQAWDNGNRLGIMTTIARRFAKNKATSFKRLDDKLKEQLQNFNISETEWNKLRPHIDNTYMSLDVVDKINDDDLKAIRASLGQENSPLVDIKNQLYRKMHTLFDVSANNAILTPGAYENSILLMGTRPGTIAGEFMRTVAQFKGFGVSFVNRGLVDGWRNAGDGYVKKSLFLAQMFGYMMPLAYMSTYFFNLSRGVSTPSISDMSMAEKAQLMAAPLGVLAMGFDPTSQNSDLLGDMLFGAPSARLMSSISSAAFAGSEGNTQKLAKNLKKALQYTMPGSTFPFVQPYLKKAMGEKTYTAPGQHILYGR